MFKESLGGNDRMVYRFDVEASPPGGTLPPAGLRSSCLRPGSAPLAITGPTARNRAHLHVPDRVLRVHWQIASLGFSG
jgi:hypothetical protein